VVRDGEFWHDPRGPAAKFYNVRATGDRSNSMFNSDATTREIRVEVESRYVPERSEPSESNWFFVYDIRVSNLGNETVQLLSRHWIIADSTGEEEEVQGPGVVGQQPTLQPGESFEYTSACPLKTPFGSMRGSYQMIALASGEQFDVEIAPFSLAEPFSVN